jgi:hypothetical protein
MALLSRKSEPATHRTTPASVRLTEIEAERCEITKQIIALEADGTRPGDGVAADVHGLAAYNSIGLSWSNAVWSMCRLTPMRWPRVRCTARRSTQPSSACWLTSASESLNAQRQSQD